MIAMRLPLTCLLLALALPAGAQIYSYTDANGNTVFTSQPPEDSNATPVQLPPLNTMDSPQEDAGSNAPDSTPAVQPYQQLNLIDLPSGEALRANNGTFTVRAQLVPPLRPGHSLQLLLDGQPYGPPTNVPLLQLTSIDRGEHSLALQVLAGSTVVQVGPAVSFTVQRVNTQSPALRPPPPPPKPTPKANSST